mmetsp:Transcript_1925/g.2693  ORF Transcript_1925/g.2693 Transcript_1925/m.2693 type:complete len:282 (+) Transcript_1925:56-901(+)
MPGTNYIWLSIATICSLMVAFFSYNESYSQGSLVLVTSVSEVSNVSTIDHHIPPPPVILDLRCGQKYYYAFFHQIYDCFLTRLNEFHYVNATGAQGIIDHRGIQRWVQLFYPSGRWIVDYKPIPEKDRNEQWNRPPKPLNTSLLDNLIGKVVGKEIQASTERKRLLWISRKKGRRITREDEFVAAMRSIEGVDSVDFYHGNESQTETILKFQKADIVVGVHGAGLVNTVFGRNNICVVEFTTMMRDFGIGNGLSSHSAHSAMHRSYRFIYNIIIRLTWQHK